MKRILSIALCGALCAATLAACGGSSSSSTAASAETLTGTAKGFGGDVTATLTAVAAVQDDVIVAAYIDEFQFFDAGDDVTGVPNNDADFGADYAEGKVLGSKRENDAYYYVSRPSAHVGWTGLSFLTGCL